MITVHYTTKTNESFRDVFDVSGIDFGGIEDIVFQFRDTPDDLLPVLDLRITNDKITTEGEFDVAADEMATVPIYTGDQRVLVYDGVVIFSDGHRDTIQDGTLTVKRGIARP